MRFLLHLWIYADNVSRLSCCRLYYLPLSKPMQAQRNILWCIKYAGYAYRSDWDTKPDLFTDSNILRWTWPESNRRPEVLRFEGVTTILLFNYLS
jgi:hypothetical protein